MKSADRTKHIPCPHCGAEAKDGEDTATEVELEYEFGGSPAIQEMPAKVCPACGAVFAL